MTKIYAAAILALVSFGSTAIAYADTNTSQRIAKANLAQPNQVARLQTQVNILTSEVTALQTQTNTPAADENVINNLPTGG